MGSVIVYTLSKAFTKLVYDSAGHFMWNGSNFLTNCIFKLFKNWGWLLYTFDLRYPPQRKKSHGLNQLSDHFAWPCMIILKPFLHSFPLRKKKHLFLFVRRLFLSGYYKQYLTLFAIETGNQRNMVGQVSLLKVLTYTLLHHCWNSLNYN